MRARQVLLNWHASLVRRDGPDHNFKRHLEVFQKVLMGTTLTHCRGQLSVYIVQL
jgi:hypothetical protein